jgi:hypothetical protein
VQTGVCVEGLMAMTRYCYCDTSCSTDSTCVPPTAILKTRQGALCLLVCRAAYPRAVAPASKMEK